MAYAKQRVLIYRVGSLGDTITALPALRLVEQAFPDAERWILTNVSVSSNAPTMAQVLKGTGLAQGYIEYPILFREPNALLHLRRTIRQFRPEVLVNLASPRGRLRAFRDAAFFYSCGIRHLIGIPYSKNLQTSLKSRSGNYEYEGAHLLRSLCSLGHLDLNNPISFDLNLTDHERTTAKEMVAPLMGKSPLIAVSIGTKWEVNDWGIENWTSLLERLSLTLASSALVMLGAEVDQRYSNILLHCWKGTGLNLCGQLTVRESAAVLEQAHIFIGHDSGPMHMAAAVGTPCVAIFSSRNLPGQWFPYGAMHKVLYQSMPCQGCGLNTCPEYDKACIRSISVDQVEVCVHDVLSTSTEMVTR